MAHEITPEEAAANAGYDLNDEEDYVRLMIIESVVPACCSEGCEVEPDGRCPHGFEAVPMAIMF